jgi:predicted metal-dependent hydrolase
MDARLREGIRLFNDHKFFASHEVLESFYHDTDAENKPFLEGLIQLAAAFRLFSDFGEAKGSVRMIYQALMRFENYQPAFLQVRVAELCQAAEAWAKAVEASDKRPTLPEIPKIQLRHFNLFS